MLDIVHPWCYRPGQDKRILLSSLMVANLQEKLFVLYTEMSSGLGTVENASKDGEKISFAGV